MELRRINDYMEKIRPYYYMDYAGHIYHKTASSIVRSNGKSKVVKKAELYKSPIHIVEDQYLAIGGELYRKLKTWNNKYRPTIGLNHVDGTRGIYQIDDIFRNVFPY